MNADDARILTNKQQGRRVQETLEDIDTRVYGAASCGFSSTTYSISGFSSYEVRQLENQLELRGFRVDTRMGRIGISW